MTHVTWPAVYGTPVYEFLNVIAFSIELDRRQEQFIKEWRAQR